MRTIHRYIAVLAVFVGLYLGCTGTLLQLVDLETLLSHAPATDPNLEAIREGLDGPPNFAVITTGDYSTAALPSNFNFDTGLNTVIKAARAATDSAPMKFVELRMLDGKPVGLVWSVGKLLRFDAVSGTVLAGPDTAPAFKLPPLGNQTAFRNQVKGFHRWTAYFGPWGQLAFVLVALVLAAMILSGVVLYCQLLAGRARTGRRKPFWSAGGAWRNLHRGVGAVAALFLVVVVLSGTFEAINSGGSALYRIVHGGRPGLTADVSSPLTDDVLPTMLDSTLAAFAAASPDTPIKVLRLRYFAGMPQGIIVSGGPETRQFAFNAATGGIARFSGPDYPPTGQTFGWQWDQIMKKIHRGDFIGLPGRWMSLFAGLSLIFLSLSGAIMYYDLWTQRRRAGNPGLFWP